MMAEYSVDAETLRKCSDNLAEYIEKTGKVPRMLAAVKQDKAKMDRVVKLMEALRMERKIEMMVNVMKRETGG